MAIRNKFFTDSGTDITEKVLNQKTIIFVRITEAEKYASQIKSYYYQVFDNSQKHIGYGVPI